MRVHRFSRTLLFNIEHVSSSRIHTSLSLFLSLPLSLPLSSPSPGSLFGMLNGTSSIARAALIQDGLYSRFLEVVTREHTLAFGDSLAGEDTPFGLPMNGIPTSTLGNFTGC